MKMHPIISLLYISFLFPNSSFQIKRYNSNPIHKNAKAIDLLLRDSIHLTDTTNHIGKTLSSESPKKISRIQGQIVNWMAVLIDDPILWHQRMKSFSIYVIGKKQNNHEFEIELFTLGSNGLPDKKLTSAPLAFNIFKKGWNEFKMPALIEVPENGIILAFRFKKRSSDLVNQENSIGIGVYTTNKQSYIKHKSEWVDFPIYQPYQKKYSQKVSLMFKITTNPLCSNL